MKPNPRKIAEEYLRLTPWEIAIYAIGLLSIIVIACYIYGQMGAPQ